jgi:transposase
MIQLIPQLNIWLACQPVDFRCGIDSLVARCRRELDQDAFDGSLFVFRNRRGTALKMLCYDGLGCWLVTRRFSQGRIRWWPDRPETPTHQLQAQQLAVLLYHGLPDQARFAPAFRKWPQAARAEASASA